MVYIDATHWYTRLAESISSEAYYTGLGLKEARTREVLAIVNHPTEGAKNWQEIFTMLKKRGVRKINLFVGDGLTVIENAIAESFSKAQIQLCIVHLNRGIFAKVKPKDKAQVSAKLKEVCTPTNQNDTQVEGHKRFISFLEKWKNKYPSVGF